MIVDPRLSLIISLFFCFFFLFIVLKTFDDFFGYHGDK